MSFVNLRKSAVEEDSDDVSEGVESEDVVEDDEDGQPIGWGRALWQGFTGPSRWISARTNPSISWGVHGGAAWACGFYGGWVATAVTSTWLAGFLAFVPREHKDRLAAAIEYRFNRAPDTVVAPIPGGEREAVRRLLLDVMGDADKVHLSTVLAHLQEHGQWEGRTVTDLRARLAALSIPHDRKVKVAGVPTWGVRRAHLEAPSPPTETSPSPTPSPPV